MTGRQRGKRRQVARATAVLAVVAALAAGCSSGSKTGAGPTTTVSLGTFPPLPTQPATTVDATRVAVLAAYRASWADYLAVVTHFPIQPSDPRLGAHTSGVELDTIHVTLTKAALASQYAVGTIDLAPIVVAVNGSTATVDDCYFDHTKIVNGKTGAAVSAGDTQRTAIKATMTFDGGAWKMSNYQKVGAGCTPAG